MTIPSKYFHHRSILLFLIINSVLLAVGTLLVLFRLDSDTASSYIIEYRANLGIGEYEIGNSLDVAGFVFFLIANFIITLLISIRSFNLRKNVSVMVLVIASLITVLTIIVSNALMTLR